MVAQGSSAILLAWGFWGFGALGSSGLLGFCGSWVFRDLRLVFIFFFCWGLGVQGLGDPMRSGSAPSGKSGIYRTGATRGARPLGRPGQRPDAGPHEQRGLAGGGDRQRGGRRGDVPQLHGLRREARGREDAFDATRRDVTWCGVMR